MILGEPKSVMERRDLLGSMGAVALAAVAGCQETRASNATLSSVSGAASSTGDPSESAADGPDSIATAVTFVRNVEEVRGHLASSASLLEQDRQDDGLLHAGHGSDYYGPVLTPLRDEDPELATELRGHLSGLEGSARSMSASEFESYIDSQVSPLLTDAVEAVVDEETRTSQSFHVRVMNALAGRIADEYIAAVPSAGTIDLVGEYWDARGFLTRIEERYATLDAEFTAGGSSLAQLRTQIEGVEAADAILETTLSFRMETAAAVPLSGATVDDPSAAVTYLRNLEELRGHLASSVALIESGDESAATLHAGHGGDYIAALLPAVQRENPSKATELLDLLLGIDDAIDDGASAYASHVNDGVLPAVGQIPAVAVPGEYTDDTSVDAGVILALAHRIGEEYDAAVTGDEKITLYGEYWDARGFLTRVEERYAGIESDLDADTAEGVSTELDILRTELETAATPADVAGSIDKLDELLAETAV